MQGIQHKIVLARFIIACFGLLLFDNFDETKTSM